MTTLGESGRNVPVEGPKQTHFYDFKPADTTDRCVYLCGQHLQQCRLKRGHHAEFPEPGSYCVCDGVESIVDVAKACSLAYEVGIWKEGSNEQDA